MSKVVRLRGAAGLRAVGSLMAIVVAGIVLATGIFVWQGREEARIADGAIESWLPRSAELNAAEAEESWTKACRDMQRGLSKLPLKRQIVPDVELANKFIGEEQYSKAFLQYQRLRTMSGDLLVKEAIYTAALAGNNDWLRREIAKHKTPETQALAQYERACLAWVSGDYENAVLLSNEDRWPPGLRDTIRQGGIDPWLLLVRVHALSGQGKDGAALQVLHRLAPSVGGMTECGALKIHIALLAIDTADRAGDKADALEAAKVLIEDWPRNASWAIRRGKLEQVVQRLQWEAQKVGPYRGPGELGSPFVRTK